MSKPTNKPRKTQATRSEESDKALREAAAKIAISEGYAATTLERVGEVSGYSRSLATQKYGSKEGLIRAMIDALLVEADANYDSRCAEATDPLDEVGIYTGQFLEHMREDDATKAYFVVMTHALANRLPIQNFFKEHHKSVQDDIADIIRRGQDEKCMDPELDPDVTALIIGCFQLGLGIQSLISSDLDIAKMTKAVRRVYEKALTTTAAGSFSS